MPAELFNRLEQRIDGGTDFLEITLLLQLQRGRLGECRQFLDVCGDPLIQRLDLVLQRLVATRLFVGQDVQPTRSAQSDAADDLTSAAASWCWCCSSTRKPETGSETEIGHAGIYRWSLEVR